ncbi:head-tail adaptor [Ralstonia phage RPSC1]|uniref:Putative head to tail joining protein n=1 Tax=Ralstonia phage RPSC1 TaxID=2041351 RepID=A0A2Z2U7Y0_9CAUD|nr:head-tail adaptor [Ralstonia phage RPSC1]ATN92971.1 putative head to tail joining protein [Ralstonia phage RPSC1]
MATPGDRSGLDEEGAKATYTRLVNDRGPYTTRAEKNAQYTIPSLFPKESDDGSTDYATPFQSVGARGLNNLAAKITLSLLPVGQPFFRLNMGEFDLKEQGDPTLATQAQLGLSMIERICMAYAESAQIRPMTSEMAKQLLVAGNALVYWPPDMPTCRMYKLLNYVCERDATSNVLQLIAKDLIAYSALPEEIRNVLPDGDYKPNTAVELYTHVYRDSESDDWLEYQEVEGEVISGTENTYPADASPWIPVRLYKQDGENYGRSFVEEYIGDLVSLEKLSASIVQFATIASKILFMVQPNSSTSVRRLAKAQSGDFIPGKKGDIEVFQLEKFADFATTKQVADAIEQRLAFAFLLNSAVQRSGDRVTAEEIRYVSNELEATLGGVYSVLSSEFQLPTVKRLLIELQATSKIPQLPPGALKPSVITGIDAIGRGQDASKLQQFQLLVSAFLEKVSDRVDFDNLLLRAADASGLDPAGLILSDEQMQTKLSQQAAQQGTMQAAAAAGNTAGAQIGAAGADPEAMAEAMA